MWRGRRRAIAAGLVLFALATLCAWAYLAPGPQRPGGEPAEVILPPGSSLPAIAARLGEAHVITSPAAFMTAAVVTGAAHKLKAGEYAFASGESLRDVLSAIRRGAVVRRFITIPEGLTSHQAADILREADFLTGPLVDPPEGSLLPETYEVRRGETRVAVVRRMEAARDKLLSQLWAARPAGLPYRSPEQAVILASVVEKETGRPEERPRIAAVFINRLKKNMRLESDPTVIYGLSAGAVLGHGLRKSELSSRSPYNTYQIDGLPPTPIANPGRAALAAALAPARTDDHYFVADGTGGHVFASSFAAHQSNVERWRAVEESRRGGGAK